ncbi:hypothetical protein [Saccharibacillus sp. JS10]|uniref:hypothetical protein n=1 Tax=Saccharibacillus sp. JS10 TaxID=2950552 RepID=UPI002109A665|nr:hypothetical protein [Saccharibacillus sp. JS10]MCQ4087885.1 hypothetical protein [Saccharibacillus sp. JS10]
MSYLFYFTHKNVTDFTQIGTLWFEKGFEKINIKFTDDSQLVSPATNIEQALTIQNDLVKKFGEDWGLEALSLAK